MDRIYRYNPDIANDTVIGTLSVTSIKSHEIFTIRPTIT